MFGKMVRVLGRAVFAWTVVGAAALAPAQALTVISDGTFNSPLGAPYANMGPPCIGGGTVVFSAQTSGTYGLFRGVGTSSSTVFVAYNMLPGTSQVVFHFDSPFFGQYAQLVDTTGRVVSSGAVTNGPALMSWNGLSFEGHISTGNGVLMPETTATFSSFGHPSISNGVIAFRGINTPTGQAGIFTSSTTVMAKIANTSTTIPGGSGTFTAFNFRTSIHNGTVAFAAQGNGGQVGVYTSNGGPITKIADTNTSTPDNTGTFVSFGSPVITSDGVSFIGTSHGGARQGIYTTIGGGLTKVVDSTTTFPGSSHTYEFSVGSNQTAVLAGSGSRLVFQANQGAPGFKRTIFTWKNGTIHKIAAGDEYVAPSLYVYWVDMGIQPLEGDTFVFKRTISGFGGYQNLKVDLSSLTSVETGWELYE